MAERAPTFGERLAGRAYRLRRGAYGVALDGQRVLVVDALEGRFLPGGALLVGETALAALRREVLEETGYAVVSVARLGDARQLILTRAAGEPVEKAGRFFTVRLSTEPVSEPTETGTPLWVDAEEALATLTDESHRWALRRALAGRDRAAVSRSYPVARQAPG